VEEEGGDFSFQHEMDTTVANCREMSKTAKGDAQNCIAVVDRTRKVQSPLSIPIKTKANLNGLVINLISIYP
jgi:hypothetical protein